MCSNGEISTNTLFIATKLCREASKMSSSSTWDIVCAAMASAASVAASTMSHVRLMFEIKQLSMIDLHLAFSIRILLEMQNAS
jgi:hypothetical protein